METIKNLLNKIKANDKIKHLLCNFIIVVILGLIFNPVIGLSLALIASLLKELYDEYRIDGSGWDWKDIIADLIGIFLGILVVL